MAAMPVLKPLHDEAGARAPDRLHVPGGVGQRARRRRRARQAGSPGGRPGPPSSPTTAMRSPFRRPRSYKRPIAFNVLPFAGIADRRRRVRDRRGAQAPQREPQDPRHPRSRSLRHVRARARVHGSLAVDQRRVRTAAVGRARLRDPRRGAGRRRERDPYPARSSRQRPVLRRPHPPRSRVCPTAAAWRSSSATTISGRALPSTPSRSPSYCSDGRGQAPTVKVRDNADGTECDGKGLAPTVIRASRARE